MLMPAPSRGPAAARATGHPPVPGGWHKVSRDIDEQALLLPDWPQEYLQLERGALSSQVRGVALSAPVTVFHKSTDRRLHKRFATPRGALALALLSPASDPVSFQGRVAAAGSALLLPPAQDFDLVSHGRFDVGVLQFDAQRLQAWVGCVRAFEPQVIGAGPALARIQCGLHSVLAAPQRGDVWQLEAQVIDLLGSLPDRGPVPRRAPFEQARRLVLERAQAGDEALSLEDLAQRLDVSVRWLHQSFRQQLGLPPRQYVQQLRLSRVRSELRASGSKTVSDVAMKWGFWHLGRFARSYRAAFGELPSETLRGARGAAH